MSLKSEIERYTEAAELLDARIREARIEARNLREEKRSLSEYRARFLNSAELYDKLNALVEETTKELPDQLELIVTKIAEAVERRFDTMLLLATGMDPESVEAGKTPLLQLIREFIAVRKIPVRITLEAHLEMSLETKLDQDHVLSQAKIHGLDIPILIDNRIPYGVARVFIPGDPAKLIEINVRTGSGCDDALKLLSQHVTESLKYAPAGLKKPEGRSSP